MTIEEATQNKTLSKYRLKESSNKEIADIKINGNNMPIKGMICTLM